ncbi:hypothetical protein RHECNPAF_780015 [Rhizobium etli CNPAF512]|nr:hypothetical protein RHECNPAF_780015 [Rhizobium etli CNPAF512]
MKQQNKINSEFLDAAHAGDLSKLVSAKLDGADVNAVHKTTGLQALHLAIAADDLVMVRYLAEQCGAQFGPDGSGRWPSVVAAEYEVSEAVSDYVVEAEAAHLRKNGQLKPV